MDDFDFLAGTWSCATRRLTKILAGCEEWYEFPGTSVCRSFFEGAGSFEEVLFPTQGFSGATVRLLDRSTGLWSIYWVNSTRPETLREPPVVGRFQDGVGVFECEDVFEGRAIRVRYTWSRITPVSAHYAQSFSADGGASWEANWVSELTRVA